MRCWVNDQNVFCGLPLEHFYRCSIRYWKNKTVCLIRPGMLNSSPQRALKKTLKFLVETAFVDGWMDGWAPTAH